MSVYPFSIGLIPSNGSSVYVITYLEGYWYSLYVFNDTVRFMSLDPNKETPSEFTYEQDTDGITLTTNYGSLNATLDQVLGPGSYPEIITIKPQINSLSPNTLYAGVQYVSDGVSWLTSFAKIPLNNETNQPLNAPPFGGVTENNIFPSNFNIIFVPSTIIQEADFNTPWESTNGVCQSPKTIIPFLSVWMKGSGGCKAGNANGCIFTTYNECKTNLVIPYCLQGQNCGECVGSCTENKICAYDYCAHTSPYYSCNPECPNPPNEEESNLRNFYIAMIVVSALALIIAGIAKYKKTAIFFGILVIIWVYYLQQ